MCQHCNLLLNVLNLILSLLKVNDLDGNWLLGRLLNSKKIK